MKTLISLVSAALFAGAAMGQNPPLDTIPVPVPGNPPTIGVPDTFPGRYPHDTGNFQKQWNRDSATMQMNKWNNQDSANILNGGTRTWVDTIGDGIKKTPSWGDQPINQTANSDQMRSGDPLKSKMPDPNKEAGKSSTAASKKATSKVSDRVMMNDGEMSIVKNGKETKMTKNLTLPDGTIITKDGTVKMPDGNSLKLKDGEHIKLDMKPSTTKKKNSSKKS